MIFYNVPIGVIAFAPVCFTTPKKRRKNQHRKPKPIKFSENLKTILYLKDIYTSVDEETVAVMIELVQGEGGVQPLDKDEVLKLALEKFPIPVPKGKPKPATPKVVVRPSKEISA